ncbi:hypothetical protein JCM8202_001312 [Rhodotorula sphaerocarpa]
MKKDKVKRGAKPPDKILFYLHGGAHFFSSLETHRYQIVRHARKLGARAFAPSQRLAPQYPFPCALHDALAAYLFLIDPPRGGDGSGSHGPVPPERIILSGDSAGGGLALSLLMVLRDLELPMPAGATLISPWVDLAHSFPSVGGDGTGDYIPANGFIYRPDIVWPPPPDPRNAIEQVLVGEEELQAGETGGRVRLEEQVQMYCHNRLLNHPLVSPVNAGSLGGLPPLYICCGGSELLRDEIMYVAHKAANPTAYPPSTETLETYPSQKAHLEADLPPTKVQLQVFDGGCHVATTLAITSLAKYMFRGAANAGLFFLEQAVSRKLERREPGSAAEAITRGGTVHTPHRLASMTPSTGTHGSTESREGLELPVEDDSDDSEVSIPRTMSSTSTLPPELTAENETPSRVTATGHLPAFAPAARHHHKEAHGAAANMIRQRVSLHGLIRPLEPPEDLPGCRMRPDEIGKLHAVPVRKWLAQRRKWDDRFAKDLAHWREVKLADRARAEREGYLLGQFRGGVERPPLGSVAGWADREQARRAGASVDEAVGKKTSASMALAMWAQISNKPNEEVVGDKEVEKQEEKMERKEEGEPVVAAPEAEESRATDQEIRSDAHT